VRLSEPLAADALAISLTLNNPVYDAVYLALARAESCQLVTADDRLLGAVRGSPLAGLAAPLETR
jgi:predicted nucleic acid-binding protein